MRLTGGAAAGHVRGPLNEESRHAPVPVTAQACTIAGLRSGFAPARRAAGSGAVRAQSDLRRCDGLDRRRAAGRDRHRHEPADASGAYHRHRRFRLLHLPEPAAWPLRFDRRARRVQEARGEQRAARCRRLPYKGADARNRQRDRGDHRHGGINAAAVRRRGPEDRRGEGHRADGVERPQPDRRGRSQGWRDRRQLQQLRFQQPRERRLQHQRQPRHR